MIVAYQIMMMGIILAHFLIMICHFPGDIVALKKSHHQRDNFQPNHRHLTLKDREGKRQVSQGFTPEQINWRFTPAEFKLS